MTDSTSAPGRRAGASELLRDLGLMVDGPQLWGRQIPSRKPGVFVIELPRELRDAPVDIVAVRRWLEGVPSMTLDGETPTPEEIAKRLHEFWLPDEPILYVGRSAKAITSRLAAMYATPLGDARPHSGGHWLRTLSVLSELRVWWSETDAHEEYEDALLAEVAKRNAALGRDAATGALLPFANLTTGDGVAKAHGIAGSLRTDATADAARAGARTTAAAKAKRAASAATRARKPPRPKDAPLRPTTAATLVSQEGLDNLNAELENLKTVQRPEIIARVATARSHGDLKENAEYEYARKEQSFIEGRIQALEQLVSHAELIDSSQPTDAVRLGSTVDVESDGELSTYSIVGSTEAKPALGRLSNNSPVGRALLGARAGDEVVVELPGGSVVYKVLEVR
jgi:transcription elongation factor GreA